MTATDTTTEVATRRPPGAGQMIATYADDIAAVAAQHVDVQQFIRVSQGALRANPTLMQAAQKDPASLMSALMEAARLGLEPGSEEYYLTPRGGKVLGIVGYRGEMELMHRAGAVTAVIAEVVREHDEFVWETGTMDRPNHKAAWFGERGPVIGAYAYAHMRGGSISKVVIIGPEEIKRARDASGSAGSSHSPWATDYAAMVLKTAIHRLATFVPTSAEYREALRGDAAAVVVDTATGEITGDAD